MILVLTMCVQIENCWARGFGGGERRGGGGFSGGAGRSGGERMGGESFSGDGRGVGSSYSFDSRTRSGGTTGLSDSRSAGRGTTSRGDSSGSATNRSQVNSFLGLPSDGGTNHVNYTRSSNTYSRPNDFDINTTTAQGPRGGYAAGVSATGPQGNTAYRGVANGAYGGAAETKFYEGENGVDARQNAIVGPYGSVAARGSVNRPYGGYATRGAYVGRYGAGMDHAAHSAAGRYTNGVAIRSNFNHWGYYGSDWYSAHPGAWYSASWDAGAAWRRATWDAVGSWIASSGTSPMYYNYGDNITYENDKVYVNGQKTSSTNEYYDQAKLLAMTGVEAQVSKEEQWMSLGVFALSKSGTTEATITLQIAVNKSGIIRGNDTNNKTNKSVLLKGAVDKKTQRVSFVEGANYADVFDTGLYNLTKDESPILLHFGANETETWQLTRLQQPTSK